MNYERRIASPVKRKENRSDGLVGAPKSGEPASCVRQLLLFRRLGLECASPAPSDIGAIIANERRPYATAKNS
jgi:hypothetical protein